MSWTGNVHASETLCKGPGAAGTNAKVARHSRREKRDDTQYDLSESN